MSASANQLGRVKVSVWMDQDVHRRLKVIAAQRGQTVSLILRGLAENWIDRQEEKR